MPPQHPVPEFFEDYYVIGQRRPIRHVRDEAGVARAGDGGDEVVAEPYMFDDCCLLIAIQRMLNVEGLLPNERFNRFIESALSGRGMIHN